MTRIVTVNGREWELFEGVGKGEPAKRHRPTDERKAAVLEEAFAALDGNNFTEIAHEYRIQYYGDAAEKNEDSVEFRNQIKNIAKKLRYRASK